MREKEGARGSRGVEVKEGSNGDSSFGFVFFFCSRGGEEEENLAGCLAVALHTNTWWGNTRAICLTLPSFYLGGAEKIA